MKHLRMITILAVVALTVTTVCAQQPLELYLDFDYNQSMQEREFAAPFCSEYAEGINSPSPDAPSHAHPGWIPINAFGHDIRTLPSAGDLMKKVSEGHPPANMATPVKDGPVTFAIERLPDFYSARIQQLQMLSGTYPKARLLMVNADTGKILMKLVMEEVFLAYYSLTKPTQPNQFSADLSVDIAAPPASAMGPGGMLLGAPSERFLVRCNRVQTYTW